MDFLFLSPFLPRLEFSLFAGTIHDGAPPVGLKGPNVYFFLSQRSHDGESILDGGPRALWAEAISSFFSVF